MSKLKMFAEAAKVFINHKDEEVKKKFNKAVDTVADAVVGIKDYVEVELEKRKEKSTPPEAKEAKESGFSFDRNDYITDDKMDIRGLALLEFIAKLEAPILLKKSLKEALFAYAEDNDKKSSERVNSFFLRFESLLDFHFSTQGEDKGSHETSFDPSKYVEISAEGVFLKSESLSNFIKSLKLDSVKRSVLDDLIVDYISRGGSASKTPHALANFMKKFQDKLREFGIPIKSTETKDEKTSPLSVSADILKQIVDAKDDILGSKGFADIKGFLEDLDPKELFKSMPKDKQSQGKQSEGKQSESRTEAKPHSKEAVVQVDLDPELQEMLGSIKASGFSHKSMVRHFIEVVSDTEVSIERSTEYLNLYLSACILVSADSNTDEAWEPQSKDTLNAIYECLSFYVSHELSELINEEGIPYTDYKKKELLFQLFKPVVVNPTEVINIRSWDALKSLESVIYKK